MKNLKFQGDIALDEIFNSHKIEIYDNILNSITSNYLDKNKNEIAVVKISINEIDYTINLSRDKFIGALNGAITFYESHEEYEKCAQCLKIINTIKNTIEL